MARDNLIINPSFKTNTTGWSATGSSTITRITTDSFSGSSCLEITKAAAVNSGAIIASRISVSAGNSYAVSVYVKVPEGQETGTLQINVSWYTALTGGSLISTTSTTGLENLPGNDWVRLVGVMTAPALALGALVSVVQPVAGTVSKKFYADAFMFEAASYVGAYFDDITQATENRSVNLALTPLPQPHLTGMKLQADISLNNFTFNTVDEYGVVWVVTDIGGWWQHPSPEIPEVSRGWGDGSYDVKGKYNARDITFEGVILTPDPDLLAAARDRFVAATNLVYTGAWLKTDEGSYTKASYVRLSGDPEIQTVNARGRTEFSIGLRAADPIKYKWNTEDSIYGYENVLIPCRASSPAADGTEIIENEGNYPVSVYLTITGPLVGPTVISNDTAEELITITGTLRDAISKTINIIKKESSLVTIGTTTAHGLVLNDVVTISGLGAPYDGDQVLASIIGDTATSTQFTYELPESSADGLSNVRRVKVASTTNIATTGYYVWNNYAGQFQSATLVTSSTSAPVIDGVTLSIGDRVLIKDQTTPANNGIYTYQNVISITNNNTNETGVGIYESLTSQRLGNGSYYLNTSTSITGPGTNAPLSNASYHNIELFYGFAIGSPVTGFVRASDSDTMAEIAAATLLATSGTSNSGKIWLNSNQSTDVLGTTAIAFAQSTLGTAAYGPDTLEINTYDRSVFLNGEYLGARSKLEVYNDWITLYPGNNTISFYDEGSTVSSTATLSVDYRSGWLA